MAFPKTGEWPCFRRDGTLQSRSPGKGTTTSPAIAWKHFVGTVETLLVVEPGPGDTALAVPGRESQAGLAEARHQRWGFSPPLGELEGRTQPVSRTFRTTYAHVLPGEPGLQKIEFESGFAKPTVDGEWDLCVGRCFAWRMGRWVQVWETELVERLFEPLPIVGDFDGDGRPEVAILPWRELLVYDARTGRLKDRCRFTRGRSYGFFGAYDLNGDGKSEFLVQSSFCKHVDVLGYRDGKLELLWQREIEMDISNPQTVMRVGPNPVADVDGDGQAEVLLNVWNEVGDGRWHVTAHDAMTGAIKLDLVDQRLQGLVDIDGDGAVEMLTLGTTGYIVPRYGTIAVHSFREGELAALWRCNQAAWQTWDPPLPDGVSSTAVLGRRTVLCRTVEGRPRVVFRQRSPSNPEEVTLTLAHWEGGGLRPITGITGGALDALALDAQGNVLVRCATRPGEASRVAISSGEARTLSSQRVGFKPGTAVLAWPDDAGRPAIIVQGTGEELVAFHPPKGKQPGLEAWRLRGRGQDTRWPLAAGSALSDLAGDLEFPTKDLQLGLPLASPVVADLLGDGRRQVVYATVAPGGWGRLVAVDLGGDELWHHDFPRIPGRAPTPSCGGIILWQTGHFTEAQRQDVLVTVRRSVMHSEETYLLSGRDGSEIWHRDRQPTRMHSRAVGGTPFAIADYDGDGLDDVASFHPSVYYALKGNTGENLICMVAVWEDVPAKPVYWGIPIAGDFERSGRASLFYATDRASMTGLVRADGTLVWWDALDKSPKRLPAIGDLNGDGRLAALGIGYEDGMRCYDAATGAIKWRMSAPAPGLPAGTAAADINGDGRDEALFAIDDTLYCVGASEGGDQGELRWQVRLPAQVGPPSIADVDGGGKVAILLVGEDGYVYCVNQSPGSE